MGPVGGVIALAGFLVILFVEQKRQYAVLLAFPLLFTVLMIFQKANFTRNMLVALPYFAMFAGLLLWWLKNQRSFYLTEVTSFVLCILTLAFPAITTLAHRAEMQYKSDSRDLLIQEASTLRSSPNDSLFCSGELWLSFQQVKSIGCKEIGLKSLSPKELFQMGATTIVAPSWIAKDLSSSPSLFLQRKTFDGTSKQLRIVKNPEITVLQREHDLLAKELPPGLFEFLQRRD